MKHSPVFNFARIGALLSLLCVLSGCRFGPAYKRPDVPSAPAFRGEQRTSATKPPAEASRPLAEEKWWALFGDAQLQELIRRGLAQNYSIRLAAERVIQAQALVGIAHAEQLPSLAGSANFNSNQMAKGEMGSNPSAVTTDFGRLGLAAAWNLDFWGRYRNASEAAREQMVASEWAHRAVMTTLVANIASAYFQLRGLDLQLEIARKTLETRQETLKLTLALDAGGSGSMLAVRESEQLVYAVQAQITDLERLIEQQENAISLLVGETPHPIARGLALDHQPQPPELPVGIPSDLLMRRPDIQQAEAQLIAANAEINAARAAYFPTISLTGSTGSNSNALTRLFTGPSQVWNFGPSLYVPLFDGARIRNSVRASESQQRQAVLSYQQSIASAFRDVSTALVAYRKYREYRLLQEQIALAAADALRLAKIRYEQGQFSYLDVLINDRSYLGAQIEVATAKQNELLSLVQLYNALGGGWQ